MVLLGDEHANVEIDIAEFMRNADNAERAMNELAGAAKAIPEHQFSDAEVEAVREELRKAGFDPAVRDGE